MRKAFKTGCLLTAALLTIFVAVAAVLTGRAYLKRSREANNPPPVLGWDFIDFRPDLRYVPEDESDSDRHTLDLFLPREGEGWPLAVVVHGGSFLFNSKATLANVGVALARHGVAAVVVNYRLVPSAWPPGQMNDVSRAVAWAFQHAEQYGIDRQRIFLVGHSAGAFLSALAVFHPKGLGGVGIDPRDLGGVVLISGFYDIYSVPLPQRFAFGFSPRSWHEDSPINHLTHNTPRLVIVYAQDDIERPAPIAEQSNRFFEAVRELGIDAQLIKMAGEDHQTIMGRIGRQPSETLNLLLAMMKEDQPETPLPSK
ncbi:MAG: alpha/beta hydrolase [Candidatus Lernaella stagnicola]|nr:alpha/beta hydrolase [Candidatus Lernaella stagnicola]